MQQKRYNTNADKREILKGLEFFESSEDPNLVNPREIKDLMDKLELKDKMPFIYKLIDNLCSNREIKRKGGLTKDEFISYLEDKMNDPESKEGIHTLYDVFTDSNSETLPMTNFCRTAKEIGDNEKDQELKELLENADMTGRELTFDEFYEIMKNEDENKQNLRYKKNNQSNNKYSRKYYGKKEDEEPPEDKNSERYSYKRVKIDQPKPKYVEEQHVEKEGEPEEVTEKKIVIEQIVTTTEKEIEEPVNDARDKYKNNYDKNEDEGNTKKYSYQINRKVYSQKETENNDVENSNEDKGDGSDSKRYHRRYRASNKPNETKTETNVTYNRYRRKV